MPRSIYDFADDNDGYDAPMFRGPASGRSSPALGQLGWRDAPSARYDESDDEEPAFLTGSNRGLEYGRASPLALPAPPSPGPGTVRFASSPKPSSRATFRMDTSSSRTPSAADTFPTNPKTPYEVLSVSEHATQDEIKKAYKKAALRYHPDLCKGGEEEKLQATHRFQLIGEAFAILGDPKRRAEYDISRRERQNQRSTGRSNTAKPTSFRSTFVPEPKQSGYDRDSSAYAGGSSSTCGGAPAVGEDLRDVDPFYLFTRIFGDLSGMYSDTPAQNGRKSGSGQSKQVRQQQRQPKAPSSFDQMGDMVNHPFFAAAGTGGKPFSMQDSHTSAHMNRHGRLNISKTEKSIKMTKGGGFSFESHSFSGSFNGGNMDMLQQFLGGGGGSMMGMGMGGQGGGLMGGPSQSGGFLQGGNGRANGGGNRSRRQSFSSPTANMLPSPDLQRRPSLDVGLSFDDAYDLSPPAWPSSPGGSSQQLQSFGGGQRGLSRQDDWGNGW